MRLRFGTHCITIVSDAQQIAALFKAPAGSLSTKQRTMFALRAFLGSPRRAMPFYEADDSGVDARPLAGCSMTRPEHRIFHLQAATASKYLSGAHLARLSQRYTAILARNLDAAFDGARNGSSRNRDCALADPKYDNDDDDDDDDDDGWVELPDLYAFLRDEAFRAAVEAMCGPYLLSESPSPEGKQQQQPQQTQHKGSQSSAAAASFVDDFWRFDRSLPWLVRGLPRWLYPAPYRARDRVLQRIKAWHAWANAHTFDAITHAQHPLRASDSLAGHVPQRAKAAADDIDNPGGDDDDEFGAGGAGGVATHPSRTAAETTDESDAAEWEQYFGSALMRERQRYARRMDAMDADARAAEDLALLFAYVTFSYQKFLSFFFFLTNTRTSAVYSPTSYVQFSARRSLS